MSHFFPSHETSVILYLVLYFSEVWKYEMLTKSEYCRTFPPVMNPLTFFLISYTLMHERRIKRSGSISWFYSVKTNPRLLCQEVPVGLFLI